MMLEAKNITVGDIIEDIKEVSNWVKRTQQLSEAHDPMVDPAVKALLNVADCSFLYRVCSPVTFVDGALSCHDQKFLISPIIHSQLKGSDKMVVFACTIGPEVDALISKYFYEGHYFEGYVADACASFLVEQLAHQVHRDIQNRMVNEGDGVTNRFSPGYCNWNVEEQQKLFKLFPNDKCRITLTESSLMKPIKSISGIIGAGKGVQWQDYYCSNCSRKDCTLRSQDLPATGNSPGSSQMGSTDTD